MYIIIFQLRDSKRGNRFTYNTTLNNTWINTLVYNSILACVYINLLLLSISLIY